MLEVPRERRPGIVTRHSIDLVLMDVQIPMDGFEATVQIRAEGGRQIPIAALAVGATRFPALPPRGLE